MDRGASTTGLVHYMADHAIPSLSCNSRVLITRDRDGSDAGYQGVDTVEVAMPTNDERVHEEGRRRTIGIHGFELLARPPGWPGLDFHDQDSAVGHYCPECAKILREAVQSPAHLVHG